MRSAGIVLPLAAAAALLAGCATSPTYGTGTPADQQLLNDVTSMFALGSNEKKAAIDYKPRPELVKPAEGEKEALPQPQQSVASANSGAWPESPEERRKRYRDYATAHQDDGGFTPLVDADVPPAKERKSAVQSRLSIPTVEGGGNQRADFNKRLAQKNQGSPTVRRYLSEPPLDYRQPAPTAPTGDVGEDEWKKEARAKKAAKADKGWRDYIPWL